MKSYYKKLIGAILIFALICCLPGCGNGTNEEKTYSDRVYVKDHLFISDEEANSELPDDYICIGTVETLLSKNEPVEANNASNCLSVGSELYLPDGVDLDNMTSPVKLYGKDKADSEYMIFSLMLAIG